MTLLTCLVLAFAGAIGAGDSGRVITIEASAEKVGKYEKLELLFEIPQCYSNPFDPEEVDLVVRISSPNGKNLVLPAFYCQDYERRKTNQGRTRENCYYPLGGGAWKARFAPTKSAAIEIQGLKPGDYSVEWWDTWAGTTIRKDRISSKQEIFTMTVPPFNRDIACKIQPQ